jgi:hypothetical protein
MPVSIGSLVSNQNTNKKRDFYDMRGKMPLLRVKRSCFYFIQKFQTEKVIKCLLSIDIICLEALGVVLKGHYEQKLCMKTSIFYFLN